LLFKQPTGYSKALRFLQNIEDGNDTMATDDAKKLTSIDLGKHLAAASH
jgi:hypothetical protein